MDNSFGDVLGSRFCYARVAVDQPPGCNRRVERHLTQLLGRAEANQRLPAARFPAAVQRRKEVAAHRVGTGCAT